MFLKTTFLCSQRAVYVRLVTLASVYIEKGCLHLYGNKSLKIIPPRTYPPDISPDVSPVD